MIDMSKVKFSHVCDEEYPMLLNYVYEASNDEKRRLIQNDYGHCKILDLDSDLLAIDFEIMVHSENEFTFIVTAHDGINSTEVFTHFYHNVSEWLELIPGHDKLKFRKPEFLEDEDETHE